MSITDEKSEILSVRLQPRHFRGNSKSLWLLAFSTLDRATGWLWTVRLAGSHPHEVHLNFGAIQCPE